MLVFARSQGVDLGPEANQGVELVKICWPAIVLAIGVLGVRSYIKGGDTLNDEETRKGKKSTGVNGVIFTIPDQTGEVLHDPESIFNSGHKRPVQETSRGVTPNPDARWAKAEERYDKYLQDLEDSGKADYLE